MSDTREKINATHEKQFDYFPLTCAQRNLYLLHTLQPENPAFNLGLSCAIQGNIDILRLQRVVRSVLETAPALCTVFIDPHATGAAEANALQLGIHAKIANAARHFVPIHQMSATSADAERAFVIQALERAIETPIAPHAWPQGWVELYQGANHVYLICVCSHLVADAYSVNLLFDAFAQAYADDHALVRLRKLLAYHPALLVNDTHDDRRAYALYAKLFDGFNANAHAEGVLTPQATDRAATLTEDFPAALVQAIHAEHGAAQHGVFPLFLAAYLLTLSAMTGTDKLVVGVPVAGRIGAQAKNSLGYFVHTNPLPIDLAAFDSLDALCRWLAKTVFGMVRHQCFDFWKHTAALAPSLLQCPPALTNAFTFYDRNVAFTLPDAHITLLPLSRSNLKYPFSANVALKNGSFTLTIECAERFLAAQPHKIYQNAVHALLHDTLRKPLEVQLFSGSTSISYSRISPRRSSHVTGMISAHFARMVQQYPENIALEDNQYALSYRALALRVNELAQQISSKIAGEYVGISFQPGIDAIVTIMAILQAGKAYVPLDPNAPIARLAHILRIVNEAAPAPLTILTDHQHFATNGDCHSMTVAELGAHKPLVSPVRHDHPPAYIIFTSGSTGKPKGVIVGHANVLRLLQTAIPAADINAGERWCLFHSLAFDFSVWEIFGALLTGSTLVIPSQPQLADPLAFLAFLQAARISILNQTPAAFRRLQSSLIAQPQRLPALRRIIFGGESLEASLLDGWWSRFHPQTRMFNMYGITETTVHSTIYALEPDHPLKSRSIIGRPLEDLGICVVDQHMRPVPLGCSGELLLWGPGLARGYLNRPQLTATRFLTGTELAEKVYRSGDKTRLLADGQLEYLGRLDRQIQLRGYRIELGEIETALRAHPEVRDAIVKVVSAKNEEHEPFLAAWIIPATTALSREHLRAALAQRLPAYMRPASLIEVESFPMTVNGKIDEAALPPAVQFCAAEQLPVTLSHAEHIACLFAQVLGVDCIQVDERFFEVGGTSMHLMALLPKIRTAFAVPELSAIDLFEHSTARSLANHIAHLSPAALTVPTPNISTAPLNQRPQRSQNPQQLEDYWQ